MHNVFVHRYCIHSDRRLFGSTRPYSAHHYFAQRHRAQHYCVRIPLCIAVRTNPPSLGPNQSRPPLLYLAATAKKIGSEMLL